MGSQEGEDGEFRTLPGYDPRTERLSEISIHRGQPRWAGVIAADLAGQSIGALSWSVECKEPPTKAGQGAPKEDQHVPCNNQQVTRSMTNVYAYEARRRAHQLREQGHSQRSIARTLGMSQQRIAVFLREPPPDAPLNTPEHMSDNSNVRNLQEVWPHLSIAHSGQTGHKPSSSAVVTPAHPVHPFDYFDTDDTPLCICAWALNGRHKSTGRTFVWLRTPDAELVRNRARMRWLCPQHNPILTVRQSRQIATHSSSSSFIYYFENYTHADSARRMAHRLQKRDKDGSYILLTRETYGEKHWYMASVLNLTPRHSSFTRAKTTEIDTHDLLPGLRDSLQDIEPLRHVSSRHLWHLIEEEDPELNSPTHPQYDIITSSTERTIVKVSERVLGRRVYPGETISEVEWGLLVAYIKRFK